MRFPQTFNTWMFAMFKILYIHNCWNLFFVPEPLWNSDKQKLSNLRRDFFYHSVISPFAIKLFLLPFTSHCSTQNIGFSDFGYVIKPPQPSSAVHGAPPFTGYPKYYSQLSCMQPIHSQCIIIQVCVQFFSTIFRIRVEIITTALKGIKLIYTVEKWVKHSIQLIHIRTNK